MAIQIKANFNKMTKDSKKELVQFYLKGEAEEVEGLQELCREIVTISVNGLPELTAEFKKTAKDSNKTVIDFIVNPGAANDHKKEYYALVGKDVEVEIDGTDEDPDEFKEELKEYEKGLKQKNEEQAKVDPNQTTLEQFTDGEQKGQGDGKKIPFTDPPEDDDDELF